MAFTADRIPPKELTRYREAFSLLDVNGDGLVGISDLIAIYDSLGKTLSEEDARKMLSQITQQKAGSSTEVSCMAYVSFMARLAMQLGDEEEYKKALECFEDRKEVDWDDVLKAATECGCTDEEQMHLKSFVQHQIASQS